MRACVYVCMYVTAYFPTFGTNFLSVCSIAADGFAVPFEWCGYVAVRVRGWAVLRLLRFTNENYLNFNILRRANGFGWIVL